MGGAGVISFLLYSPATLPAGSFCLVGRRLTRRTIVLGRRNVLHDLSEEGQKSGVGHRNAFRLILWRDLRHSRAFYNANVLWLLKSALGLRIARLNRDRRVVVVGAAA